MHFPACVTTVLPVLNLEVSARGATRTRRAERRPDRLTCCGVTDSCAAFPSPTRCMSKPLAGAISPKDEQPQ